MDPMGGSLAARQAHSPAGYDPSVLVVVSDPELEALPTTLRGVMPELRFDVSASRDDGLSKLEVGHYHSVISDARVAEAGEYSLIKCAQTLSCPVPIVVVEKNRDSAVLSRVLAHGAFDMIRYSLRGTEAAEVVRRALWLYHLRLTIYNRRQRLETLRRRHAESSVKTAVHTIHLLQRTIHHIAEADLLCERTIQQIESSIRVLQEICDHFESDARECALRTARLL